jgi:hypothetical protein
MQPAFIIMPIAYTPGQQAGAELERIRQMAIPR